jgi:hypothetical protein
MRRNSPPVIPGLNNGRERPRTEDGENHETARTTRTSHKNDSYDFRFTAKLPTTDTRHGWPVICFANYLVGEASQVMGDSSRMLGEASWVLGEASQVVGETPRMVGDSSQVVGPCSQVPGPCSRVLGPCSQVMGTWSRMTGGASRRSNSAAGPTGPGPCFPVIGI